MSPTVTRLPGAGRPAGLFSAAGIAAAVATAATGVVDWTVSDDQDRRLGLFHGVLNTAALGLQGMWLAARLAGYRRPAQGLGAASLAVTGAAAYLGGHLVFAKAVMVSRVAGADGPRRFRVTGRPRWEWPTCMPDDVAYRRRRQADLARAGLLSCGTGPDGLPCDRSYCTGRCSPASRARSAATGEDAPRPARMTARYAVAEARSSAGPSQKEIVMAFIIGANLDAWSRALVTLVRQERRPGQLGREYVMCRRSALPDPADLKAGCPDVEPWSARSDSPDSPDDRRRRRSRGSRCPSTAYKHRRRRDSCRHRPAVKTPPSRTARTTDDADRHHAVLEGLAHALSHHDEVMLY